MRRPFVLQGAAGRQLLRLQYNLIVSHLSVAPHVTWLKHYKKSRFKMMQAMNMKPIHGEASQNSMNYKLSLPADM